MNTAVNKFTLSLITTAILMAPAAFASETEHGNSITEALSDSTVKVELRARYEGVDQDGIDKDASAATLKSRITVKTGSYSNFSMAIEVDKVDALVDNYNSKTNGNTEYPVVTDPQGTDVNQAYIKYENNGFSAVVGRQRVLHNNQRFVGGVGWRQNEQTYDGVRAQYKADAFSVDYSYIQNINDITANNVKGDFHLANGIYKINKSHKVSAFAYLLDYDAIEQAQNSSSIVGALYNGNFGKFLVNASLASQSDNGDNPTSYSAMYINAEAGYNFGPVTLLAGYELLGSDNGVGFNTPLATKHKFNGWTDKFLGTPGEGLQDVYITAKGKVSEVKWAATYHDFSSDVESIDFGSELNLVATYQVNKNYGVLVKAANYSDGDVAAKTDTNKIWVQLTAKF
ncbi:MAG: alginate export family protein [Colwellia sp.]|uniref:alginate export family protein n=1 Tax=Colwellia sp. TaxID=56799 RepID=UPI001DB0B958|nr:alginate export family protein [Colwellia sp.]NQY50209.1 alginate export family protein [Colwellia sp.]